MAVTTMNWRTVLRAALLSAVACSDNNEPSSSAVEDIASRRAAELKAAVSRSGSQAAAHAGLCRRHHRTRVRQPCIASGR